MPLHTVAMLPAASDTLTTTLCAPSPSTPVSSETVPLPASAQGTVQLKRITAVGAPPDPGPSIGTQRASLPSISDRASTTPSTVTAAEYSPEPVSVAANETSATPAITPGATSVPPTLPAVGAVSSSSVTTIAYRWLLAMHGSLPSSGQIAPPPGAQLSPPPHPAVPSIAVTPARPVKSSTLAGSNSLSGPVPIDRHP